MATNDMTGEAIPVSLIADPFARQIVLASQNGTFGMQDGGMNPLDLFAGLGVFQTSNLFGNYAPQVAIVILNCLPTPLTLVGCTVGGAQVNYPATKASSGGVSKQHQIPGTRAYPKPSLHPRPAGGTQLLGGVGMYRFEIGDAGDDAVGPPGGSGRLQFSCKADLSGPFIQVAYRIDTYGKTNPVPYSAVTANDSKYVCPTMPAAGGQYINLYQPELAFLVQTLYSGDIWNMGCGAPSPVQYESEPASTVTVWATFETVLMPAKCPGCYTLTVWGRSF